jgi:hypothetical protein
MERFVNMHTLDEMQAPHHDPRTIANAAWHSLIWLSTENWASGHTAAG